MSGYEELIRTFEKSPAETDPVFRPYTRNADAVKAMVTDSNAVAQEKALEAVKAFLQYGGKAAGATRETVMPAVVDKCFGAARGGTKKAALDIVELYAEMEDVVGCEGLVLEVLRGTTAKQPKIVACSTTVLANLARDFGPKQVGFKPILKKMPDIFGHADKGVRQEASILAQELHKWIGVALEPTLASLKDIQARELREQFVKLDEAGNRSTAPVRYLASQRPSASANEADGDIGADKANPNSAAAQAQGAGDADPFEFAEPVDPFKSKDWPDNLDEMLSSPKWLERKEVLDQCLKVLDSSPKLIHTPAIDSLVDTLSEKIKKDANINVCLAACQCITKMALGLRSAFAKNKDKAIPALLEKLKERKESTVKVLGETLDAVFQTVTLSDILEPTLNATKHKNPAVKTGSIQFLARCLRETRAMPAKGDIKPIADALVAAMGDGSADVREAGAQGLGTLMKLIGERPMNQYLDSLDDIKKGKVHEQYKVAIVKVKQSAASAPSRAQAPIAAPIAKPKSTAPPLARQPGAAHTAEKENAPPPQSSPSKPVASAASRGPPARLVANKVQAPKSAPAGTTRAAAPSSSKGHARAPTAGATEPVKFRFGQEDAEARAAELVPTHIAEELSNSVWKERLAGMGKFNDWLKLEVVTIESELVVRFLARKPGWKESNFQVMAEVYNALRLLAQESGSFGRPSVALSVSPLCEKLGDVKLKNHAGETLYLYAEKTSLGFLLNQALGPLGNIKAPKAIADSLLWVHQALLDFGTAGIDVRGIVNHLLTCLKSANAGVRTNATVVIGTLARFLGSALTNFLGDLNPQLRATVEAEIDKAVQQPAPEPTRFSEETRPSGNGDVAAEPADGNPGLASSAADEDALDALIPRVDLDKLIPSSIVSKLGDANWKERKEGVEELHAILDANTRLKPSVGDIGAALKARYADSNMQVKTLALDALAKIAKGMNRGFEQQVRTFVPPVTLILSDSKAPMRAAAARTLTEIAEQTGAGLMIPGFISVLESKAANPMLRQDLFAWLGEWFDAHPPEKGMDLGGLALPAINCLDDKLAAVRKAAHAVLPYIIMRAGYKFVMEQTSNLKAASRNTVVPLIDAAKVEAARKTPKAAPPPPSSTVGAAKVPQVVRRAQHPVAHTPSSDASTPREPATASRAVRPQTTAVGRTLKGPGVARQTMAAAVPTKLTSASASSSGVVVPFLTKDLKGKASRERKEGGRQTLYWIGPDAVQRPELVEVLRQQCETHLSSPLMEKLFSKDHNAERDYLSALTLLSDYASNLPAAAEERGMDKEEAAARAVANSDLVFKYVAIRLTDNNTSIALKCLDVLEHFVALLRSQEYHISDYEANAILPCILAKFGDPKVAFRDRIRSEILRKLTYIYPPSKLISHLLEEGLSNKNVRVRTESLGELGHLFQRYGAQVCSLPKTIPVVAKQISDRDNGVRTAALFAIGEVYKNVGDEVWSLVGKLPPKEISLLEERLKRTAAPAAAAAAPTMPTKTTYVASPARLPKPGPPPSIASPSAPASGLRLPTARANTATSSAGPTPQSAQSRLAIPSRLARPVSAGASGNPPPTSLPRSKLPGPTEIARPSVRPPAVSSAPVSAAAIGATNVHTNGHQRPPSSASRAASEGAEHVSTPRRVPVALPPPVTAEEDAAEEQAVAEILSSNCDNSVMALKRIENDVQRIAPALAKHADQLAIAFGKQLHRAFDKGTGTLNNERLKKHLLITGTSVFDNTRLWEDASGQQRTLGSFVSKSALISLLTELLQQLIETKGATDEETQTHGRYLNIIVLRSFSSCSLNVLFGACLSMLAEATEDLEEMQLRDTAIFEKRIKFADLICKCIWKITRKLNASLHEELVDAAELLQDLERFLQTIPPQIWKQRASNGMSLGEMPLRTVKVIITHIGSVYGEDSLDLLDGIPEPEQSYVYAHLLRVCDRGGGVLSAAAAEEALAEEGEMVQSSGSPARKPMRPKQMQRQLSSDLPEQRDAMSPGRQSSRSGRCGPDLVSRQSAQAPLSPSAASATGGDDDADASVNAELRSIFDRIASKSESRAAIKDLYLFQRKYPHKEASIRRSLEQTGPIFQKFIKRALANHAAEDGEPLPLLEGDETATPGRNRDSVLSSPGGLRSARSSTQMDWQANAAALRRGSFMSPSPSRNSIPAGSTGPDGLGVASPSAADRHSSTPTQEGNIGSGVIGGASGFLRPREVSTPSSPFAGTASSQQARHSRGSNGNEDRLAQLRAKFARPVSQVSGVAD